MTWLALILAGFAATGSAEVDKDQPHRDWGQVATLDMSVADATACIIRAKSRGGAATQIIPTEGGNDIDFRASAGLFGGAVWKPWITYQLRRSGEGSTLTVLYRHPYRQGGINKDIGNLAKACLRISRQSQR